MQRGAKAALLALLSGIAVTSPAWLAARADGKHHRNEHHAMRFRWDLLRFDINGVITAGGVDWAKAADGSLRRAFASSIERNVVHGSDSPESAAFEIGYFFGALEICGGESDS